MSRRMNRAANGITMLIHAVAGSGDATTRAHLAFVGPLDSVVFFSRSRKHVRSRQALLGSWQALWSSRMTTLVCTIALFPPDF
jgi:hypothetical protein